MTGVDVINTPYIDSHIFGLQMDTPLAQKLIADYYQMVELGTPFLSCHVSAISEASLKNNVWKPFNMDVFVQTYEAFPPTEEKIQFLKKRRSVLLSTDAVILIHVFEEPNLLLMLESCSACREGA